MLKFQHVVNKNIWFANPFGRILSPMEKKNVLLVDDHRILLDGIKNLIDGLPDFEVKATATDGREALKLITSQEFDILITDYELPELTGLELIKAAKAAQPEIKILVLSMHDDPSIVRELLKMSIHGYILKKDTHKSLIEALHKITEGKKFFSEEISDLLISLSSEPEEKGVLTSRELEILRLVAKEFNSRQIAEILFISERTVETHRKNILKKTGTNNLVGLIKYAYANNLI